MTHPLRAPLALAVLSLAVPLAVRAAPWASYPPGSGPGAGRHVVLVSGDEEYRSEEMLPALAKILARRHGFRATVLFAVDPNTGLITPTVLDNIPGLEHLDNADLLVLFTRFRNLPPEQMAHIDAYLRSGHPILGIRTATHAFRNPGGPYARWDFRSQVPGYEGGFGRVVLGETWISHHGHHAHESTRGLIAPQARNHPVVRGLADGDIWGPTDVYTVRLPLPAGCKPVVLGQVLAGMSPDSPPVAGPKNDPLLPIAWTRLWRGPTGRSTRVFTSTFGCAEDFASAGARRLFVQAVYWCLGLEDAIGPEGVDADLVGPYTPHPFGFGRFTPGLRPADHRLTASPPQP